MSRPSIGGVARLFLVVAASCGAVVSAPAFAQSPSKESVAALRMLDARVNQPGAFRSAMSARPGAEVASTQATRAQSERMPPMLASRESSMPGLEVRMSTLTGAPMSMVNKAGALSAPAAPGQSGQAIVRTFLAQNADLFGLAPSDLDDVVVLGDSAGGASGLRMVRVEQQIDGFAVFQSETRVLLDRQGRVVKVVGGLVAAPRQRLQASDSRATLLGPGEALARVLASAGSSVDAAGFTVSGKAGGWLELVGSEPSIKGPASARQVLFPLAPGVLVPAWSVVVFTTGNQDWYSIVDAVTGDVLWRKNIRANASTQDARFSVYVQADGVTPADSPSPLSPTTATPGSNTQPPGIGRTIVSMLTAQNTAASPNGWIDDCPGGVCTANETQTLGNNVLACLDRDGTGNNVCDTGVNSVLDGNGRPTGNPDANGRNRDFLGTTPRDYSQFLPPPQGGDPEAGQTSTGNGAAQDSFRRGVVANLFYISNWYHDRLFGLGFDEAAGNFQQVNFSGMGLGNDRVLADVQDGSDTDNANFSTPPDGVSGRMQMYRFTGPNIDRDSSVDAEIVMHELTHGTSNRLIGNGAGLNWDPAGGMGEGWSDFVALSLLNNTQADDPDGKYASGGYATYKLIPGYTDNYLYGIRRFPYSTDNTVNPLTWADVDDTTNNLSGGIAPTPVGFNNNGGAEVHNSGEVWALTLWEVRSRVIADPAGGNGSVPVGNQKMLQLVIDAMKLTPIDPSFIDGRDALFDADCATNGCANEASIWGGFADRGLGYGAKAPYTHGFGYVASHIGIKESFSLPYLDLANGAADVTVDDAATNNNGMIDPGEPVRLRVKLTNPWRSTSKNVASATATLTTSTPGVTIHTGTASYGAIAAQGNATNATPFLISVASSVPCGSAIDFTLTTVSSLGTTSTTFQLRVGGASGTGAPVTYTMTSPLAIPDSRARGAFQTMNITDDFVIADLNFRLDSVTHTWIGDLTAMLRSPAGIGTDVMSLIGGVVSGGGSGDNLVNMVMDDDIPNTAANDMVQAPNSAAPMTKSWTPVFNAPWSTVAFGLSADPVPTLSRFDGQSTKGTWTNLMSDQATGDTGTLNSWSIIVTPVAFACAPFVPTASMAATKTVSGSFVMGGTVTYTVTITNNGSVSQANNAGDEYTDALPAGLTLQTANASSGAATTAGNTVKWNGALAPLGGSVTITITAVINAAQGTTISSQGSVSYDSNGDGTNDASLLTDDPGVTGAANPTTFVVGGTTVTGTKTVSGAFAVGGTVTYTVVLTNSGASASTDNSGDEFVDVLPPALTLVSATATSGTPLATVGTNTVTWNGGLPAGGSVTITILATVNAGTGGQTVSNQGTIHYDADLNGSNESQALTDDPSVSGASNPTTFVVGLAAVTATKTVSGTFAAGGTVTYTVVLTNSGTGPALDNVGDEFTDVLPAALTLVSATATSGTPLATVGTNTVTWNGALPAGGSVTIMITATVKAGTGGQTVSNQGTFRFDANGDGTSESQGMTDDPSVGGGSNPTVFVVAASPTASATARKTVSGTFAAGGAITYTITLTNTGASAIPDNAGNEFTDVLPASLTLVSASATSGSAVATVPTRTVTWSGGIPVAGSVTITINATINAGATGTISNQGAFSYDADLNGSNETTIQTDDPGVTGASNPTSFVVAAAPAPVVQVPTLSEVGLALLALAMLVLGAGSLRRRPKR